MLCSFEAFWIRLGETQSHMQDPVVSIPLVNICLKPVPDTFFVL